MMIIVDYFCPSFVAGCIYSEQFYVEWELTRHKCVCVIEKKLLKRDVLYM